METIRGLNINGPAIIATSVVFSCLTVASVGLRFYAKRISRGAYRLDDWLLVFALFLFVTTEVLVIICEHVESPRCPVRICAHFWTVAVISGREATSEDDGRYWTYLRVRIHPHRAYGSWKLTLAARLCLQHLLLRDRRLRGAFDPLVLSPCLPPYPHAVHIECSRWHMRRLADRRSGHRDWIPRTYNRGILSR